MGKTPMMLFISSTELHVCFPWQVIVEFSGSHRDKRSNTALDDSAFALVLYALSYPTIASQTGSTAVSPAGRFLRQKSKASSDCCMHLGCCSRDIR